MRTPPSGVRVVDLCPSASGPYCVPAVNLDEHLHAPNLNIATGAAQAAVPIVAAVARVGSVSYAEVVSSVAARSAGPEIRTAVDTFIETTNAAVRTVGGARRARTVLVLNPADPPILMRTTVYCLVGGEPDHRAVEESVVEMVDRVRDYTPGYRLTQRVQFATFTGARPLWIPETGAFVGTRVTALLEVAAAADSGLPAHAGNIDIINCAAARIREYIGRAG